MRKTNLFGATFLALSTSVWSLAAVAQTPAPAPSTTPTPAPAPAPTPAPAPEAAPAAPAPDATAPASPSADTSAPAPKMEKKHMMHHKTMHGGKGKLAPTKAGDKAVADLNDASLNSAKTGKPFTPPATPEAAKKEAHAGDKNAAPMHHHAHKMMKKTTKSSDSASAPADGSATPPADTSATPPADTSPK